MTEQIALPKLFAIAEFPRRPSRGVSARSLVVKIG